MFAVQILMQTIVILRSILQDERGGFGLSRLVTTLDEVPVRCRLLPGHAHGGIPAVRNRDLIRIDNGSKFPNEFG